MDTLFNAVDKWEPGAVAYENLTVVNKGNLALKYELAVNFDNAVPAPSGKTLADALQVGVVPGGVLSANRDEVLAAVTDWQSLKSFNIYDKLLTQGASTTYGIVIYWQPTDHDNEFNVAGGLSIDLGVHLYATQLENEDDAFGKDYDKDAYAVDTSWYNASKTEFVLNSAAELRGLAALVNDGTDSFAGKTIKLGADINLRNAAWDPIGTWDNTFSGNFDGQGHVISNLYVNIPTGQGVGFFGVVENVSIENVTLHNVDVSAYSMVAGLVGAAYPATISDCRITGDVNIVAEWAYVAGIAGYCYYGTQVSGCSVIAEDTGLIQSVTRNAVGGITAWLLEGDHNVTDCHVKNLELVGWANIGGITGFVHYNNTIDGCSAENVTLTKTRADGNPSIGLIAGGWSHHATNAITLSNNTVKNASLNGTHVAYSAYNVLYGSEYGGAAASNFILDNNETENITINLVEVQPISNVADLKDAFANGGKFVLKNDLALTEKITLPAGKDLALYLNGKTIAGTFSGTGNQDMFLVNGNLAVLGGKITLKATVNQGWGAMSTIFDITAGGAVNIEDATIENLGGTDMAFCAHLNNWGTATLNAKNTNFKSTYVGIRVFNSGYDMNNLTLENCVVEGTNSAALWVHNYTAADFGSQAKADAQKALLNFNVFNGTNKFIGNPAKAGPIRYGMTDAIYSEGNPG